MSAVPFFLPDELQMAAVCDVAQSANRLIPGSSDAQPARFPEAKASFAPVVNPHIRLLLLGSLPGDKSLQQQQYYAHPHNRFWHLMSAVLGTDLLPLAYAQRLATLLAHGVGLWDVVASARRAGSLDSQIRERSDNDLPALLAQLPALAAIGFNGATAARIGLQVLGERAQDYHILRLPSSSPAYTLPFAEKQAAWQALQSCCAAPPMAPVSPVLPVVPVAGQS